MVVLLKHSLKHLLESVESFGRVPLSPISIRQLIKHGARPSRKAMLLSAQFLHNELPIRVAHCIHLLERLPPRLSNAPEVLDLRREYLSTFEDLVSFPRLSLPPSQGVLPDGFDYVLGAGDSASMFRKVDLRRLSDSLGEVVHDAGALEVLDNHRDRFIDVLQTIKDRHQQDVLVLGRAIHKLAHSKESIGTITNLEEYIDPFHRIRIGIRLLLGQHIALSLGSQEGHIGLVSPNCNIRNVIEAAGNSASFLCMQQYPTVMPPRIEFKECFAPRGGGNGSDGEGSDGEASKGALTFPYIPSVLYYMSFELIKNSLRATVDFSRKRRVDCPPIKVIIAGQGEDLAIKISDEGGGIPRSGIDRVWSHTYTTARPLTIENNMDNSNKKDAPEGGITPLAGYGLGLPISRLYARYFGGDLKLVSVYGYGTDAYVYLNRIGDVVEYLK